MSVYKVIFGQAACHEYDESQDLKKVMKVMKTHGGEIKDVEFETEAEYKAYLKGLFDGNGWEEYWVYEKDGKRLEP